jgi:hypothetical protein
MSKSDNAEGLPLDLATRHHEIVNLFNIMNGGEFLDQVAEARVEVEKALSQVGKAAEITIKIKIAPNGSNKRVITADIKTKLPAIPADATYVFSSQSGQYVTKDPDQSELPLRTVPFDRQAARVV